MPAAPLGCVESSDDDEDGEPLPVLDKWSRSPKQHKSSSSLREAGGRSSSSLREAVGFEDDVCSLDLQHLEEVEGDKSFTECSGTRALEARLAEEEGDKYLSPLPSFEGRSSEENELQAHQEGADVFHRALAAAFKRAEKVLIESHEKALQLFVKCMDEIQQQEKSNRDLRKEVSLLSRRCLGKSSGCQHLQPPSPGAQPVRGSARTFSRESDHSRHSHHSNWRRPGGAASFLAAKVTELRERSATWFSASSPEHTPPAPSPDNHESALGPRTAHPSERGTFSRPRTPGNWVEPTSEPAKGTEQNDVKLSSVFPQPSDSDVAPDWRATRRASEASVSSQASATTSPRFELLLVWAKVTAGRRGSTKRAKQQARVLTRSETHESLATVSSCDSSAQGPGNDSSCCQCCDTRRLVIDPNSSLRAVWDIMSIMLVVYDMVMIPLQLFNLEDSWFTTAVSWLTRLFWSWDIVMSFLTGNVKRDGSINHSLPQIARSYVSSWFVVDVLIVGVDWIEVLWSDGSFLGFARAGKASRTFRIIRMIRLLRLARVRTAMSAFMERIQSEQLVIVAGIVNTMLVISCLAHLIACTWFGIAAMEDRPDTWIRVHGFADAAVELQYTTALHWALLQFAGGTDEIVPQNTGERIYAVGVFLLAFIMAAVFVGRLTSSMTQLHMLSKKDVERFQMLKKYLGKNKISGPLAMRVMHNAQHALHETQRVMEEGKVELLRVISEPLRVELHFELYSPVLAVHPIFHVFIQACPQVMKKICHTAMSQLLVSKGDVVFMPGEVPTPPQMLIVCSGVLTYHYVSGSVAYVDAGQWVSEATLWTNWTHHGMLKAASDCRLCILDATKFSQFAETFDHNFDVMSYARAFVNSLNSGEIEVSDLPYHDDAAEMSRVIEHLESVKNEILSQDGAMHDPPGPGSKLRRSTTMGLTRQSQEVGRKNSVLMEEEDHQTTPKWGLWSRHKA